MEAFSAQLWKCRQDNQSIFLKYPRPICCGEWNKVWSGLKINMLQYPCSHNKFQKYEAFCVWNIQTYYIRETIYGVGFTHKGCVNPNIQEKQNFTHKNSSVDYDDMLMPLTKICRVKSIWHPFSNWHSGKYEGITCSSSNRWCVL